MAEKYKLVAVNPETGEVTWLDDDILIIGKKPYRIDKGYVKVFVTFLQDIVMDKQITGKAIRLLMYMISRLDYNSYEITIIPQETIQELGVRKQTFYEWLNILMDKGIIEKINRYKYRLQPYRAIKGQTSKVDG